MMRLLEKKEPDTTDMSGRTPLSYAAGKGNASTVNLLLKYDVNLNVKCMNGPLSQAIEGGSAAVIQVLLAQGVETNYRYERVSISNNIYIDLLG